MAVNYPDESIPQFISFVVSDVSAVLLPTLQAYDSTITGITYLYGNIKEVTQRLTELWQSMQSGNQTNPYPVVVLLEDIRIDRRNTNGYYGTPVINMFIATATNKDFTSAQRETITFQNILRPIYREFLKQLVASQYTSIYSVRAVDHVMYERKYWGLDNNTATQLQTYIDAIDLVDLSFKLNWEWCVNPVTNII